jgi:hypothetical protein
VATLILFVSRFLADVTTQQSPTFPLLGERLIRKLDSQSAPPSCMNRDELRKKAFPEYRSAEPILATNFAHTRIFEK